MVKHGIGLGALNGLMSAKLAANGYTGITGILALDKYRDWVGDIGSHYILPYGVTWKEYSCCSWAHPAILAVRSLIDASPISVREIDCIEVETYEEAMHLGVDLPETTEEAQFNLAWPIAAFLIDGEVGPRQVLERYLDNPQVRLLASKVTLSVSPELSRLHALSEIGDPAGMDAARVTIELRGGHRVQSDIVEHPIFKERWDRSRMERKFRWLMGDSVPPEYTDRLIQTLWLFDQVEDVNELSSLMCDVSVRMWPDIPSPEPCSSQHLLAETKTYLIREVRMLSKCCHLLRSRIIPLGQEETAKILVKGQGIMHCPQAAHGCQRLLQLDQGIRIVLDLQCQPSQIGNGFGLFIGVGEHSCLG